ncbi:hypothetical protein F5X96DRAFT_673738 [Biscogniauxia mediterranea]|nr:hypothetical protein F5X96DRAFT_673738 [Biscogniauxia mediterranea]
MTQFLVLGYLILIRWFSDDDGKLSLANQLPRFLLPQSHQDLPSLDWAWAHDAAFEDANWFSRGRLAARLNVDPPCPVAEKTAYDIAFGMDDKPAATSYSSNSSEYYKKKPLDAINPVNPRLPLSLSFTSSVLPFLRHCITPAQLARGPRQLLNVGNSHDGTLGKPRQVLLSLQSSRREDNASWSKQRIAYNGDITNHLLELQTQRQRHHAFAIACMKSNEPDPS